jgi:hypothetical protein
LGAALCWGVGDFLGGLTARRIAVLYHANQLDAQAATRPVGDD